MSDDGYFRAGFFFFISRLVVGIFPWSPVSFLTPAGLLNTDADLDDRSPHDDLEDCQKNIGPFING